MHGSVAFPKGGDCEDFLMKMNSCYAAIESERREDFAVAATLKVLENLHRLQGAAKMKSISSHYVAKGTRSVLEGDIAASRKSAVLVILFDQLLLSTLKQIEIHSIISNLGKFSLPLLTKRRTVHVHAGLTVVTSRATLAG